MPNNFYEDSSAMPFMQRIAKALEAKRAAVGSGVELRLYCTGDKAVVREALRLYQSETGDMAVSFHLDESENETRIFYIDTVESSSTSEDIPF